MRWDNGKRLGLVMLCCLGLTGCFIRIALGLTFADDLETFIRLQFDDVSVAYCRDFEIEGGYSSLECEYSIEIDDFADRTSTSELLSKLGVFGLLVDPLILQIPEDLQLRTATYDSEFGSGSLDVLTAQSVPIDAADSLTAQPGTKLVIFDLPSEISQHISGTDPEFGLSLDFDVLFGRNLTPASALDPFEIKALFTLPFDVGGVRYYLPMLPCVRSFAEVTPIVVNPANGLTDLQTSLSNVAANSQGCSNEFYDFNSLGPQLLISHSELEFGAVEVGRPQTKSVTISAAGIANLSINSTVLSGAAAFAIQANDCEGASLFPGDSCAIQLSFTPLSPGESSATLTIQSNDPFQFQTQVAIEANATSEQARAEAACQSLDLGPAGQGQVIVGRNAFWNTGLSNLTIASVGLAGSPDFQIQNDECAGKTLHPGFGCLIEARFSSVSVATQTAQLTITSDAGSAAASLSGVTRDGLIHTSGFESRCDISAGS